MKARLDDESLFIADGRVVGGLALTMIVGALANAAGVGGGAVFNPLFNAVVGFSLKSSTSLSQACIAAGSLVSVCMNLAAKHPENTSAPLIDLHACTVLTPLLLVGVGVGVMLNQMLPAWLLTILLACMLVLLCSSAAQKGHVLWRKETEAKRAAKYGSRWQGPRESELAPAGPGMPAGGGAAALGSSLGQLQRRRSARTSSGPLLAEDGAPPAAAGALVPAAASVAYASLASMEGLEGSAPPPHAQQLHIVGTASGGAPPTAKGSAFLRSGRALQQLVDQPALTGDASPPTTQSTAAAVERQTPARQVLPLSRTSSRRSVAFHDACSELGFVEPPSAAPSNSSSSSDGEDDDDNRAGRGRGSRPGWGGLRLLPHERPLQQQQQAPQRSASVSSLPAVPGREVIHVHSQQYQQHAAQPLLPNGRAAGGEGGQQQQVSWLERRSKWRINRRVPVPLPHAAAAAAESAAGAAAPSGARAGTASPHALALESIHEHMAVNAAGAAGAAGIAGTLGRHGQGAASDQHWYACRLQDEGVAASVDAMEGVCGDSAYATLDFHPSRSAPTSTVPSAVAGAAPLVAGGRNAPGLHRRAPSPSGDGATAGEAGLGANDVWLTARGAPQPLAQASPTASIDLPVTHSMIRALSISDHDPRAQADARRKWPSPVHARKLPAGIARHCCLSARAWARRAVRGSARKLRRYVRGVRQMPAQPACLLLAAWGSYLGLQVARGRSRLCSRAYFGAFGAQLGLMLLLGLLSALLLRRGARRAAAAAAAAGSDAHDAETGDGRYVAGRVTHQETAPQRPEPSPLSSANLLRLGTLATTIGAGLTGGLLGLGGGMVMGPLLLQLGLHPQATCATSSLMVLFSSSAAVLQLALLGRLNVQYGAVFAAASALASLMGVVFVTRAIRRSGHPSLVVLSMTGIMALGLLCVAVFGTLSAVRDARAQGGLPGFTSLCDT